MKRIYLVLILISLFYTGKAQTTGDVMIGGGFDIIKTDIDNVFNKVQAGFEVNYFLIRNFSVTGGFDIWSADNNSVTVGFRWYPANNLFLRYRGLIGENEFDFGIGYSYPLKSQLRLELMGDYFVVGNDFALRGGIAYILRGK